MVCLPGRLPRPTFFPLASIPLTAWTNARFVCAWVAAAIVAACGPAFNWREAPITGTSLVALFPCKPQSASRVAALGGKDVELTMTGCDTAGVTLAVGHATIADPALRDPVLAQWRAATLVSMRAKTTTLAALRLESATPSPQSVLVNAVGTQPDGRAVVLQAAWFTRGTEVFVALLYGDAQNDALIGASGDQVKEAFFSGLKFR